MDRPEAQPRFLGALILLPLALLAGLGIFSLRQDRALAEIEAKDRCQDIAANYARAIAAALQNPAPAPFSEITIDTNGRLVAIGGSSSRAVMTENASVHPLAEDALTDEQLQTWRAACSAEYNKKGDAPALLRKFIKLSPPSVFLTNARYDLALEDAEGNDPEAEELFAEIGKDRGPTTEAGVPLFLLAEYQLWKLGGREKPSSESLCSNAVEYPTLISPMLLTSVESSHGKWRDLWQRDEAAREFYRSVKPSLVGEVMNRGALWTHWDGTDWLITLERKKNSSPPQFSIAALPDSQVATAVKGVEPTEQHSAPYANVGIEIAGQELLETNRAWPLLARADATLASGAKITVSEYLARPDLLFARARVRAEWFAALIVISTAVALVGFVSAHRGFHQQRRLGEMKSNFVSSVSHELRAPIASIRLLAENLERGKIAEPAKQKEYFGLMAQESRRLAMMIENVLDFSRIERGAKQYEFDAIDLGALLDNTLQLMRHWAEERQVRLVLKKDCETIATPFSCDPLALQQALINLVDNAVKHSPSGGKVTIGLECTDGGIALWVEDNGTGIPSEEHEKIFERFYRRGSELRRETQGIGIGLSIVKHIVDAHGGRVMVRSAPGQGSRFTMELPRR